MNAVSLIETLQSRGFTISADGGSIKVSPSSALVDEDRQAIRSHKAELLELLTRPESECEISDISEKSPLEGSEQPPSEDLISHNSLFSHSGDDKKAAGDQILAEINRKLVSSGRFRINTDFYGAQWRWQLELEEAVIEKKSSSGGMNSLALPAYILAEVRAALAEEDKITGPWRWTLSLTPYPASLGMTVVEAEGTI